MAYSFASVGREHQAVCSSVPSTLVPRHPSGGDGEPTRLAPRCSLSIACYFLQPRLRRSARNSGHGDGHARDAGAPCIVLRLCVCAQECVNCAGDSRNASVTTVLRSLDPSSLFCTLVNDRSTVRYFQLRTCRECWSA